MKRGSIFFAVLGAAAVGAAAFLGGTSPEQRASAQPNVPPPPVVKSPAEDAAHKAILANVKDFTESYNRRDVMAILKLFTDDCTLTEADGTVVKGLKELEAELKETFDSDPNGKISVSIENLRMVSPDVVVEEGKTTYFPDGKTLTAETPYQATHVKKGDKWLMSQARSFNRVVLSPYDQLRELEWLIGDWIDEHPDSVIETTYRWDPNKSFLLQEFAVRIKGKKALTGTQRIGRDPLTKQLRGWVFDSEGGYVENAWTNVDDNSWVIKGKGVRADGVVVSTTNELTRLGKDRMRFDSVDRIVGDERMPPFSAVTVRKPPQPKQ